jgi:hypothetical protein
VFRHNNLFRPRRAPGCPILLKGHRPLILKPGMLTFDQATCPRTPLPRHLRQPRDSAQARQDRPCRQLYPLLLPMGRLRCLFKRLQAALEAFAPPPWSRWLPSIRLQLRRLRQDFRHEPSQGQPRAHSYWREALHLRPLRLHHNDPHTVTNPHQRAARGQETA